MLSPEDPQLTRLKDPVRYAIEKNAFYILDERDREFKGRITLQERTIQAAANPTAAQAVRDAADASTVETKPPNLQVLETKLYKWSQADAIAAFGQPSMRKPAVDMNTRAVTGEILTFPDKTRLVLTYDLTFGSNDGLLRSAVAYPLGLTWSGMKKLMTGDFTTTEQPDGSRIHGYLTRRLGVLEKDDKVISIAVF
ncbi:MAG TPA: hypothetical protein VEX68_01760 [Bryobacteraceae bacterium]|nr:hypothetical protein [Bryobacteraceae bacterium]